MTLSLEYKFKTKEGNDKDFIYYKDIDDQDIAEYFGRDYGEWVDFIDQDKLEEDNYFIKFMTEKYEDEAHDDFEYEQELDKE